MTVFQWAMLVGGFALVGAIALAIHAIFSPSGIALVSRSKPSAREQAQAVDKAAEQAAAETKTRIDTVRALTPEQSIARARQLAEKGRK